MYKHLTVELRYKISAYINIGMRNKEIAKDLNISESTISREIKRNQDSKNKLYKPKLAQEKADIR